MKVIHAVPGAAGQVSEQEVTRFLESRLNLQLATIDKGGYPVIQPVWFLYDRASGKLLVGTNKASKKVENIRLNPDKIYFSIDDESSPPKGVKGRATASMSWDVAKNTAIMQSLNMKYLGTQDHPLAKMLVDSARAGTEIVIEMTPTFFSAWDFAKGM